MTRPTTLKVGGVVYWVLNTYTDAGVLVDADTTPTVAVRKNGASTVDVVTVTKRSATTGIYDCSYNPASETEGDAFAIQETATISTIAYVNSWSFQVLAAERGTDGANTVVPDAAGTIPTGMALETTSQTILTDTGTTIPALIPTAGAIADQVWDEATSGHTSAGTYGGRVVRSMNSNVEVQITGSNHIAADVHEFQTDVITAAALAADAVTEIQSGLATQASVDVIDGIVDTILIDTDELQTDWANGGRLDLLLDAIPTTPMRGTDSAALAATALSTAVWTGVPTGFLAATFPTTLASTTNITGGTITTVGTCTTNSDMRGTDGANTVVPDAAGTIPSGMALETTSQTILTDTGTTIPDLVSALTNQPSSAPVERSPNDTNPITFSWPVSGATITAEASLDNAAYGATVGAVTFLRTEGSLHYYSLAFNAADRPTAEGTSRYKLADGTYTQYVTLRVEGASTDAAGIRSAVGLASANLDSQLGTILADTDELQLNQGDWTTATGFSTHAAADVWTVGARTVTGGTITTLTGHTAQTGDSYSQLPTNLSALAITAGGATDALVQGYMNTLLTESTAGRLAGNQSVFWDNADALTAQTVDDVGGGGGGDATLANQTAMIATLAAIKAKTDAIGGATVTVTGYNAIDTNGLLQLQEGLTLPMVFTGAQANQVSDMTGEKVFFNVRTTSGKLLVQSEGTITTPTGTQVVQFDLTAAEALKLVAGRCEFDVVVIYGYNAALTPAWTGLEVFATGPAEVTRLELDPNEVT